MSKPILEGLNPQQTDAVTHSGGPLLILAGAGSGKTRVITHKFAYLSNKMPASSILAVTFTNKAAGEMKERISHLTKKDMKGVFVGTFHSQCSKILRKEAKALGYRNDFTIYNDNDQSKLIRHILKDLKIYEAMYKGVLSRVSYLKSSCISPEDFLSKGEGFGFEERLARVYVRYQDELKRCNSLDFDDLIMLTVKLFEENPSILNKYRTKFRNILVDEFQDTNNAQYRLLKLLAMKHNNICVVGDDDQGIYGFRGACIKNIIDFEKDFPKSTVIKLEQNYRSTPSIIKVSNSVVKDASQRRDKTLRCSRQDGEKVTRSWFSNEKEEAKYIAKLIKELYLKGMYDYKDFSVLYRINLQSKPIEDALRQENISYCVLGGTSFYARKEIMDIIAYMKLVLNNDDNVSLRRIINCPPRGIGASTISKIEQIAKKNSSSLYAAINFVLKSGKLTSSSIEKLKGFMSIIDDLSSEKYKDAADMLQNIYIKTGYSSFVGEDKVENIAELIMSAEGKEINAFIDSISLASSSDNSIEDNSVSLLTLHSAKGLEFPVVFITGVEEGVLPYFKAETPKEIDEERRLLYVGMTRAKDILQVTGAKKRRIYSKIQLQEPSRFLKNVPDEFCTTIEKIVDTPSPRRKGRELKTFKPKFAYAIGSRVKHPKWGVGVVRDCYGEADDQKIMVNFPNIGIKKLALKFANLERI
jgi:DNA helicase-2/ATP-dependent DNA helicase PcrA